MSLVTTHEIHENLVALAGELASGWEETRAASARLPRLEREMKDAQDDYDDAYQSARLAIESSSELKDAKEARARQAVKGHLKRLRDAEERFAEAKKEESSLKSREQNLHKMISAWQTISRSLERELGLEGTPPAEEAARRGASGPRPISSVR